MSSAMLPTHVLAEMSSPGSSGPSAPRFVTFGDFQLDLHLQILTKEGRNLGLHGKAIQFLQFLVERRGEVVTRQELKRLLWPADPQANREANINTLVAKLRGALHDSLQCPIYLETVPRVGYRFVANVAAGQAGVPLLPAWRRKLGRSEIAHSRALRILLTAFLLGVAIGAGATSLWILHGASFH